MNRLLNIGRGAQDRHLQPTAWRVSGSAKWVFHAGTPGLLPDGDLSQRHYRPAEQAGRTCWPSSRKAGMGVKDLGK